MANSIKLNETKKHFFIYKTTNLLNGRYYIGMHSTNNIDDGYLGSGTRLRRSIRKYGKHNFKCEILEYCSDFDSLKEREREIVTEESIKDILCMNLKPGGLGGGGFFSITQAQNFHRAGAIAKNKKMWSDPEYRKSQSDQAKKLFKEGKLIHCDWTGKKHKDESKIKIGLANSIKQRGINNSQFGKCWITNGIENMMILKDNIIPEGWKLGRVL
jgi:group I intron endonuclease